MQFFFFAASFFPTFDPLILKYKCHATQPAR